MLLNKPDDQMIATPHVEIKRMDHYTVEQPAVRVYSTFPGRFCLQIRNFGPVRDDGSGPSYHMIATARLTPEDLEKLSDMLLSVRRGVSCPD